MIIPIKDQIIEEGILDGFKSKTGLGLAGLAGVAGGKMLSDDFKKTNSTSMGDYAGKKYNDAKDSLSQTKKDFEKHNTPDNTNTDSNTINSYEDNIA